MAFNAALSKLQWKSVVGGTYADVAAISSISFSISRPTIDVTPVYTPTTQYLAGISTATATLEMFYDNDDSTHKAWLDAINLASDASFFLFMLETGETIEGQAFITSMDISAAVQNVGRATMNLQFTAAASTTAKAWTIVTT